MYVCMYVWTNSTSHTYSLWEESLSVVVQWIFLKVFESSLFLAATMSSSRKASSWVTWECMYVCRFVYVSMYVCMYVCKLYMNEGPSAGFVCMHVCIYVCTVCICIHGTADIHHTLRSICLYTFIHTYILTSVRTYIHTYVPDTYIHSYILLGWYAYIHSYIHTYIHTLTYIQYIHTYLFHGGGYLVSHHSGP